MLWFIAAAVLIIGIPILLLNLLTDRLVTEVTTVISEQHSRELNDQMASHISSSLDSYFDDLDLMYHALAAIDGLNEEKLEKYIADVQKDDNVFYLAFADKSGTVYSADGSFLGTVKVRMLGQLLAGEHRVISGSETLLGENFIMLGTFHETPIMMEGKELCIALFGITNEELTGSVVLNSEYSGGYASIIRKDGSYVVKNDACPFDGVNSFEIMLSYGLADEETLSLLKTAMEQNGEYMVNGVDSTGKTTRYLYFAPITGTDWYVINTLPASFIKTSIQSLQDRLSMMAFIILLFFALIAAVVIILQSVTNQKLKASRAETAKALETAELASNSKTAFLFNMSHDIRTPMNAILGYTDASLRHMDDTERVHECLEKIMSAGGHLLSLINDILEMSRVESGKMVLAERCIDIREAIAGVDHMSRSLAEAKGMDYQTEIGEIRNPYIYADELHINEVIINLISNGVKYTPAGGRVRYRVDQVGDAEDGKAVYRFEVSDNGIGMSEEFQTHLFETFSREETTTVSKIEGTGLGLSIVKKIIDLAGGTIHVKSARNMGSTFTVEIPFKVMDEAAIETFLTEKTPTEVSDELSLEGKRVLVVEDNEMNREIATDLLEESGLMVETAEDGEVAVRIIKEKGMEYYDFVLMDVQMPVMDGYEATRVIRGLPDGDKLPIIALSANAFEEDKAKSRKNGMNAHIAKPIDVKELFETLRNFVR